MSKTLRIGLGVAAAAVVLLLVIYSRSSQPRTYAIDGTITWLDIQQRRASLQFNHPRSGRLHEVIATIPPECSIVLAGRSASLTDLQAGDQAAVTALWRKAAKEIRVLSVKVDRQRADAAPSSATQTADRSL